MTEHRFSARSCATSRFYFFHDSPYQRPIRNSNILCISRYKPCIYLYGRTFRHPRLPMILPVGDNTQHLTEGEETQVTLDKTRPVVSNRVTLRQGQSMTCGCILYFPLWYPSHAYLFLTLSLFVFRWRSSVFGISGVARRGAARWFFWWTPPRKPLHTL